MSHMSLSVEEIARKAEDIYDRTIRSQVYPSHKGEFLVVDIDTGDYEVGEDDIQTEHRLRARRPGGIFFGMRVGYKSAYTMNGTMSEDRL